MSENEPPVRFWAVVNRGLESIAAEEIEGCLPEARPETSYRRVAFDSRADPRTLLTLRTVDDLFIDLATWSSIGHTRAELGLLERYATALDLRAAAAICGAIRTLHTPPSFSVTVNFVGRRNFTTDEIKLAVATGIEAAHRWEYISRDVDADLNLRVFLEHATAYVGLRLGPAPLHERPYKVATIAGSLKPTVAAAMVRLGRFHPGALVVDPLCGVGTIALEAALVGLQAMGGDHDISAIERARTNGAQAGVEVAFDEWDARRLPLPDASADGFVCNLPWGRQVALEEEAAQFYDACLHEMRRVIRPDGRLVLLTSQRQLIHVAADQAGLKIEDEIEISLSGQKPSILILRPAFKSSTE